MAVLARPHEGKSNIGAPVTHLRKQVRKRAFDTALAGAYRLIYGWRRPVPHPGWMWDFLHAHMSGGEMTVSGDASVKVTELCVLRHARTNWNDEQRAQGRTDIPLNARGREQARRCAAYLARTGPWDAVVSSPLSRAYETAHIIALAVGIDAVAVMDALVERDCGTRGGLTPQEALARGIPPVPADAETDEAVRGRAREALSDLAEAHVGRRVLVVTHGAWIRAALEALLGVSDPRTTRDLDNTGLSRWFHRGGAWEIHTVNELAHLDGAQRDGFDGLTVRGP